MDVLRDIELFSDLVGEIYSAALDHENWHKVVQRLHYETSGTKVFIIGYDAVTGTDLGQISSGYDPYLLRQYEEHYAHLNPYIEGWLTAPLGLAQVGDAFCSHEKLLRSEFYLDFLRIDEDASTGAGVPLFRDGERFIGFGGHFPSQFAERNEKDFLKLLSLLSPHLTRTFEVNRTLGGRSLEEYAQSYANNEERENWVEVILVSSTRRIFYASRAAQKRLDQFDLVRVDDRSRLSFVNERIDTALQMAANSLVKGAALFPVRMPIQNPLTSEKFILQILPYKVAPATAPVIGAVCKVNEPCLLITIEPQAPETGLLKRLATRYSLTPAEAEVALAIDTEKGLPEIARARNVSIWTVRSQVKSIFYKLGTSRQAGIVRIVERERHHL